jgi:hypothetical protein
MNDGFMRESDYSARQCEWLSSVFPEFRVHVELGQIQKNLGKDPLNRVKRPKRLEKLGES